MPTAMRMLYPETEPEQNFQAKLWVGGDDDTFMECTNGKVKAVVAYLRSMDNRITSMGVEEDSNTYQLQQWRNIDYSKPPENYDKKWELIPLTRDLTDTTTLHLRQPRTEDTATTLTFYIVADKFKDNNGNNYEYLVISMDKLEHKLHLLSKFGETEQSEENIYTHIEENLPLDTIFDNIAIWKFPEFNTSPILAQGTLPASGSLSISVPGKYDDPEDEEEPIEQIIMNDFVVCVRPK
jgi:hypothetical protein